jgi:hypothetical protein
LPWASDLSVGLSESSTDTELCTASTVNPEAALIDAPCIVLIAGRAADLAIEGDIAAATDVTPVSATVVGGAGDELGWWRTGWRASGTTSAIGEVGAAAAVDPETTVIDSPGLVADAGGAADLADELYVTTATDGTPVATTVVGGAGDGLLGRTSAAVDELCPATAVDPETPVVDSPGLIANTGGAADLASELNVAAATDGTPVTAAVVRGAGDALSVSGWSIAGWLGVRFELEGNGTAEEYGSE